MKSHYDILATGSYARAREAFLRQVTEIRASHPTTLSVELCSEPVAGLRGRGGEELFVDLLALGDPKARNVLVISNGVHGVEGYAGASVLLDVLTRITRGKLTLPKNVRLVMIFAVNPYGMSWQRRTDHENIDVNRNFVDFEQLPPSAAVYRWLSPALNRPVLHWNNPFGLVSLVSMIAILAMTRALRLTHLNYRIRRDLSGGQHHDSHGIFYGGSRPSASREIITRYLGNQVIAADLRRCIWLDFHTGLGRQGSLTPILCPSRKHSWDDLKCRVRQIYGPRLDDALRDGLSAVENGKINSWCLDLVAQRAPNVETLGLTLEFGARSMLRTFLTIREQNIALGKYGGAEANRAAMAKGFDTFFIRDPDWLDSLTAQSVQHVEQSLCYLAQQ